MILHSFRSNQISGLSSDVPYPRVKQGQQMGGFVAETFIIAVAISNWHGKLSESTMFQQNSDRTAIFTCQQTLYLLYGQYLQLASLREKVLCEIPVGGSALKLRPYRKIVPRNKFNNQRIILQFIPYYSEVYIK